MVLWMYHISSLGVYPDVATSGDFYVPYLRKVSLPGSPLWDPTEGFCVALRCEASCTAHPVVCHLRLQSHYQL